MRFNRIFWIFFWFVAGSSCVKEISVGGKDEYPDAFFLNAFLNSDSAARVQLGKVSGISEGYQFIGDARVVLISGGQRFPMLYREMGWYENGLFVTYPNDTVTLEVTHRNKRFMKTIRVPPRVAVSSVITFPLVTGFTGRTTGFRMRFTDSAYIENYYRLWVEERYLKYLYNSQGELNDSVTLVRKLPIAGNELSFIRNVYNTYATRELLFSDETFNGLSKVFEFHRSAPLKQDERSILFRVVLENMGRDLYDYYNLRNAHIWQQSSITQTPTTVRGNIQGVYGILGGYQSAEYVLVP